MAEKDWDLEEIKHIKKKDLIKNNLVMAAIFASLYFLYESGVSPTVIFGMICLILWIATAVIAYTHKTGKVIGTKDSQRDYDFEKSRLGDRFKRRAVIGLVFMILLSVGTTVALFIVDFEKGNVNPFSNIFTFIGALLGVNIAQINRIRKLKEYTE